MKIEDKDAFLLSWNSNYEAPTSFVLELSVECYGSAEGNEQPAILAALSNFKARTSVEVKLGEAYSQPNGLNKVIVIGKGKAIDSIRFIAIESLRLTPEEAEGIIVEIMRGLEQSSQHQQSDPRDK